MHKDEILNGLAQSANVAQFVAFRPDRAGNPVQSFSRIAGYEPNASFHDIRSAISTLLAASQEDSINIRSYQPDSPRSREFIYGLKDVEATSDALERLSKEGLYTIINETIDINDGGVSGVIQDCTIEFAPDDTPRCVEKPGVASMPLQFGQRLLNAVYGVEIPEIPARERVEFSLHPRRCGTRNQHVLFWEREPAATLDDTAPIQWPNRFSRHIGDKAFGLLVAHFLGHPVPETLVIGRRVAPFKFGVETGLQEKWFRTCPTEPVPGHFTTVPKWIDPFLLLQDEDKDGSRIGSVLCQSAVDAHYSGATVFGPGGLVIEGRPGSGEAYMLGSLPPETLPEFVLTDVAERFKALAAALGPVRFEWVHDGTLLWIVQLHVGATTTSGQTIVPGEPAFWVEFDIADGLEALRSLIERLPADTGLKLIGRVGTTSHFADLLRRAKVPSLLS